MSSQILALLENQENARQVQACLEVSGHEVTVVDTFVIAQSVLRAQKFDLIISDVHLENGGNVFDFLRWANRNEKTSGIQFVLFSSKPSPMAKYLADGVRTTARILGAVKYIEMEEFDATEFQRHINELLLRG